MSLHSRKLKLIEFVVDGTQFECQVSSWNLQNNTPDGDKLYTFCPDGESREDGEDDYALQLTFFSDWRSAGISDFLVQNDKQVVAFTLDHHPDVPAEHVTWTGSLKVKGPNVGGAIRTTEVTEVTLPIVGKPVYTREMP